ncbi:MAG TPA: PP0621 family protein [Burkholderiales bacterium]|nr:PP0621 family protein [Burkholderiales bacterium]
MKYLLIVLVVLAVIWLARSARRLPGDAARRPPAPGADRKTMLACAQCGLHLPPDEALPGRGGVFCSEAHRAEYERAHPAP